MSKENKNTTPDSKAELVYQNFKRLFPAMAEHVLKYERAGSKMISLHMDDGVILSFLYYTPMNWNLGTKPWRMKPKTEEPAVESEVTEEGDVE